MSLPTAQRQATYSRWGISCSKGASTLPDAKMAYVTIGTPSPDRTAILLPSWYCADFHGYGLPIGADKALDPDEHFLILTEMFANGASSSPSNTAPPFDRARSRITIRDNVRAAYRLLTAATRHSPSASDHRVFDGRTAGVPMGGQRSRFRDSIVATCGTAKTYPHGVARLESVISALKGGCGVRGRELYGVSREGFYRLVAALARVDALAGMVQVRAVQSRATRASTRC